MANELTAKEVSKLIAEIRKEEGAKAAMNAYVMLLEYVLPKLQRIEHTGKDGDALSVEHVLRQISARGDGEGLPVIDGKAEPSGQLPEPETRPLGKKIMDTEPEREQ